MRDAIPFLGWLGLGGHEKAMKKAAKEIDSIMEEWLKEHRRKKDSVGEIAKGEQKFIDVLLAVLEGIDLSGYDINTVTKAKDSLGEIAMGEQNFIDVLLAVLEGTDLSGYDINTVTEATALAQEELDIKIGKGRLINESYIVKLVHPQAIVKESLRLYPAGPLAGAHKLTEDRSIGGCLVPKGSRLILNL